MNNANFAVYDFVDKTALSIPASRDTVKSESVEMVDPGTFVRDNILLLCLFAFHSLPPGLLQGH